VKRCGKIFRKETRNFWRTRLTILQLLEPFRELFKDEVRALGRRMGVHEDIVNRHPFPGYVPIPE
jgi:hypothetical protein